jgi:hypothetical protein
MTGGRCMADDFLSDGFASISLSSQQARDATLLRASTDLFVQASERDQDTIRRYAELAAHLLPKVSPIDRASVALSLATIAETPSIVARLLARDDIAIADPVLRFSPALGPLDLLVVIAATGVDHHRLIAQRNNLPAEVIKALRIAGDTIVAAILDRASSSKTTGEKSELQSDSLTDDALASREATLAREVGHFSSTRFDGRRFLRLDRAARLRLMAEIATSPPVPRPRTTSTPPAQAFRSILGAAQMVGYARSGERELLVAAMAEILSLEPDFVEACLDDETGEPLAVLLKALSLDGAQAAQVFLLATPKVGLDTIAFFRICDLYAGMEPVVAETLAGAWRDNARPVPRHETVFADTADRDSRDDSGKAREPATRIDRERRTGSAA